MPGLGDLLELATTPRERLPSTEGETDIGKWLASIGAPDSAEDIFLEKEIDTLGELADAVATEDDLAQLLGADFVGVGWDVVLRLKRAGLQDARWHLNGSVIGGSFSAYPRGPMATRPRLREWL